MAKKGFGYRQWTLIKQRAVTLSCFAFVDDTDLIHSVQDPSIPTQQVLAEAQQALTTWEGLIRASSGAGGSIMVATLCSKGAMMVAGTAGTIS